MIRETNDNNTNKLDSPSFSLFSESNVVTMNRKHVMLSIPKFKYNFGMAIPSVLRM